MCAQVKECSDARTHLVWRTRSRVMVRALKRYLASGGADVLAIATRRFLDSDEASENHPAPARPELFAV